MDPALPEGSELAMLGYEAWLAARQIQAEQPDRVRVELRLVRRELGRTSGEPRGDEVRALFASAVAHSSLGPVLRALGLRGPHELRLALDRPALRETLATAFGVTPAQLSSVDEACVSRELDTNRREILARAASSGLQFPVLEIAKAEHGVRSSVLLQDADRRVAELRSRIDIGPRSPRRAVWVPSSLPPGPDARGRASELARSYPGHGALLGGPGLDHHLLIFADDERTTMLSRALAIALRIRARHPGQLSVQVIAVGSGEQAEAFTRRLCGARELGLQVPYMHWLATPELQRESSDAALIDAITAVGQGPACSASEIPDLSGSDLPGGPERRNRSLLHARGLWLDGQSVSESELARGVEGLSAPRSRAFELFAVPPDSI